MTTPASKPRQAPGIRVFHADDPAFSDSLQGIDYAAKHGYPRIDINTLYGKSGRPYGVHWPQPLLHGWVDRDRKMDRKTFIWDMSDHEISRLRYPKYPDIRVSRMGVLLKRCQQRGIQAEVETKDGPLWAVDSKPWKYLAGAQRRTKAVACIKMLTFFRQWPATLEQAYNHGFVTMMLPRGTVRTYRRARWATVDLVRGKVFKWVGSVPSEKPRGAAL